MENTTEKQIELLKLCNEKGMNFETSPKHGLIYVLKFEEYSSEILFSEYCCIDNKNAIDNLDKLIEKVKNYENKH